MYVCVYFQDVFSSKQLPTVLLMNAYVSWLTQTLGHSCGPIIKEFAVLGQM